MPTWTEPLVTAAWALAPVVAVHVAVRRRRWALGLQLALDVILLAVVGPALLTGRDLNPIRVIQGAPPYRSWHWSPRTQVQPVPSDVPLQFHPWWASARRQLLRGRVPWIAPEMGGGQPLVGNGMSGWLAPVLAPVWVLGPERGTTVMATWKLEAAGWGMALYLLLGLRLPRRAARFGGVVWAGSPFLIGWLLVPLSWVVAAVPWLALLVERAVRPGARLGRVVAAGLLGGWLGGAGLHPEGAMLAVGAALTLGLVRHPRRWLRVVAMGALAAAVAVPLVWPTVRTVAASSRVRYLERVPQRAGTLPGELRAAGLRQLLLPAVEGHPAAGDWHAGYPHPVGALGIGGAALAALLGGGFQRRRRTALGLAALWLVAAILVYRIPPLDGLLVRLPVLRHMTLPRLGLVMSWTAVVASALAAARRRRPTRRGWIAVAALVPLAVAAWPRLAPLSRVQAAASVVAAGAVAAGAPAAGVAAVELGVLGWRIEPAADPHDRVPVPPVLARLVGRAAARPGRIVALDGALPANLPARLGLADLRAFDPVRPWPLARLHALLGAPDPVLPGPLRRAPPRLGAWSVRWAVAPGARELPGWVEVDRGDGVRVWENPWWRPEVRMVTRAVVARSEAEGWRLLAAEPEALPDAVVLPPGTPAPTATTVTLEVVENRPDELVVRTGADGRAVLAVARCWAPGWTVQVDGRRARLLRVNLAGLGVVVPAGRHEVRLAYRPFALR